MEQILANYPGKAAEMLTIANIVCESITPDMTTELNAENTRITPQFITELNQRVDDAFVNILGFDGARNMRGATNLVLNIFGNAKTALQKSKQSIANALAKQPQRRDEILQALGFMDQEWQNVARSDQEALVVALTRYTENLDA